MLICCWLHASPHHAGPQGDFCYDAHNNILAQATTEKGAAYNYTEYYLMCGKDFTPQQRVAQYPFNSHRVDLEKMFADINKEIAGQQGSGCPAWNNATASINQAKALLLDDEGILAWNGVLGCFALNQRVKPPPLPAPRAHLPRGKRHDSSCSAAHFAPALPHVGLGPRACTRGD